MDGAGDPRGFRLGPRVRDRVCGIKKRKEPVGIHLRILLTGEKVLDLQRRAPVLQVLYHVRLAVRRSAFASGQSHHRGDLRLKSSPIRQRPLSWPRRVPGEAQG